MIDHDARALAFLHRRWGWRCLFVFAGLGLLLEALHGFKLAAYLDVDHETRRLMWRLAHAHGVLLGLLHLAAAGELSALRPGARRACSRGLRLATLLLPLGFLGGGVGFRGGDPGPMVLLVPIGGLALLYALGRASLGLDSAVEEPGGAGAATDKGADAAGTEDL